MKTTDPLKRRVGFTASSVVKSEDTLVIAGGEPDETVVLASADGKVTAATPLARQALVVEKIQLLGRPPWLTLDFQQGSEISRIVANIESLDCQSIYSHLAAITKDASVLFFSRLRNET